jgi:hypothetical protein
MFVATGRNHSVLNGCCTAMWKARGKTTILLLLFPDRHSRNREKCEMLALVTKHTFRHSQYFSHFLERVASSSPVHHSPYLVPLLRKLTPVYIGTPILPRPIPIHFLYIHIYVSQEVPSFQIFSSKFCMKAPSL